MSKVGEIIERTDNEDFAESVKSAVVKHTESPKVKELDGNELEIIGDISSGLLSPEDFLRAAGRDPDEWEVKEFSGSAWQAPRKASNEPIQLHSQKYSFKRKLDRGFFGIPETTPWKPPAARPEKLAGKPKLYMVTSDLQIPYHDKDLHKLTCNMAHDLKVDGWFDGGDEFDLSTLSRWEPRAPRYSGDRNFGVGLVETKEIGGQVFRERTDALPDYAIKVLCDSNHGERWQSYILKNAKELWGVIPDFRELVGLPGMGWEIQYSDYGSGTYQMAEVEITPGLLLIHGSTAAGHGKGGQSVLNELEHRINVSVMMGHCNHQAFVQLTRGEVRELRHRQFGWEIGMMADYQMPYGDRRVKDWQKGFAMVTVWPDGRFSVELIPYYDNKEVVFRDNVWRVS